MLERAKWLTIMIMIAGMIMGAQAAYGHYINPPGITIAPSAYSTQTPSDTLAPTRTSEPSNPITSVPCVKLVEIVSSQPGSDLDGEYVLIENSLGSSVNLADWTLRDDQKNVYTFPAYDLGPGRTVSVWTKTGVDRNDNLYWNLEAEVWNDGGDCSYLRDEQGDLQSYICY